MQLPPQIPQPLPTPLLPQQAITCGTRKDCIRLRGLPYEAQVEHILDFLGDYAKNIVFQGVHMVYNSHVSVCIARPFLLFTIAHFFFQYFLFVTCLFIWKIKWFVFYSDVLFL